MRVVQETILHPLDWFALPHEDAHFHMIPLLEETGLHHFDLELDRSVQPRGAASSSTNAASSTIASFCWQTAIA